MYVCVSVSVFLSECMSTTVCSAHGDKKKALDLLELGSQLSLSCLIQGKF